jgi:hypothetical protein
MAAIEVPKALKKKPLKKRPVTFPYLRIILYSVTKKGTRSAISISFPLVMEAICRFLPFQTGIKEFSARLPTQIAGFENNAEREARGPRISEAFRAVTLSSCRGL